jgi:hypothetical protein
VISGCSDLLIDPEVIVGLALAGIILTLAGLAGLAWFAIARVKRKRQSQYVEMKP